MLSVLFTLWAAVLLVVVLLLEIGAPWIAPALVGGFDAELLATTTLLIRLIVPSILIYGLSGILQAFHYARKRFAYPALGAPAHNLGVIVAVLLLATRLGVPALSLAIVVAAVTQLVVQLPGLKGASASTGGTPIRLLRRQAGGAQHVVQNGRDHRSHPSHHRRGDHLRTKPRSSSSCRWANVVGGPPTLSQLDAARDDVASKPRWPEGYGWCWR